MKLNATPVDLLGVIFKEEKLTYETSFYNQLIIMQMINEEKGK